MPIVVVPGVTGAQQAAAAAAFEAAGWTVRGTSRSGGDRLHRADLESGEGLDDVFDGAQVVAFTLPQDHRRGVMTQVARTIGARAARAGITRIVFSPGGAIDDHASEEVFVELRDARDAVREGGVPVSVVEPTIYMDNLLVPWIAGSIVADGTLTYPAPAEASIAWLSHKQLGDFIVAAACAPVGDFRVGGPENLTGAEVAGRLSRHLGRSVVYRQQPREEFAAGIAQAMGADAGRRLASFYARLAINPTLMVRDNGAESLGVPEERFEQFLDRTGFPPF